MYRCYCFSVVGLILASMYMYYHMPSVFKMLNYHCFHIVCEGFFPHWASLRLIDWLMENSTQSMFRVSWRSLLFFSFSSNRWIVVVLSCCGSCTYCCVLILKTCHDVTLDISSNLRCQWKGKGKVHFFWQNKTFCFSFLVSSCHGHIHTMV